MARRLCRRRKRSCTGLAPAYSSCRGNEREKRVVGAAWRGLCQKLGRIQLSAKAPVWIFLQRELLCLTSHRSGTGTRRPLTP